MVDSKFFTLSKNVFLDEVNAKDYIQVERVALIYKSLQESVQKPLKMILLYGKPGTGKSMFLAKLYEDMRKSYPIYLYQTPLVDESSFCKAIARDVFKRVDFTYSFAEIVEIVKDHQYQQIPIILLDEAQLYNDSLMEKIRLLSDTRKLKFVVTLHKTQKEDLIAKEHFQTRIWETIELCNASKNELKSYIQKKLLKENSFDTANMFTHANIDTIFKITSGNYRDTNKLLYTLFEIYEWYANNKPSKINLNKISNKYIEMSAIHTGLIHA